MVDDQWLSARNLADKYGYSANYIRLLHNKGLVAKRKVAGQDNRVEFKDSDVAAYKARGKVSGRKATYETKDTQQAYATSAGLALQTVQRRTQADAGQLEGTARTRKAQAQAEKAEHDARIRRMEADHKEGLYILRKEALDVINQIRAIVVTGYHEMLLQMPAQLADKTEQEIRTFLATTIQDTKQRIATQIRKIEHEEQEND